MDVRLPDLDGVEVLRRIRTDARTASLPVVAVTAQAMDGDRERFLRAGFDGYLPKPVDVAELLGVVGRYCAKVGLTSLDARERVWPTGVASPLSNS